MPKTTAISYKEAKLIMEAFKNYQDELNQKGETLKISFDLQTVQEYLSNAIKNGDTDLNIYLGKYVNNECRNTVIINTSSDVVKEMSDDDDFGLNEGTYWP